MPFVEKKPTLNTRRFGLSIMKGFKTSAYNEKCITNSFIEI